MGYTLKFNCLLRLKESFDLSQLVKGATFIYEAEGERLFPLNIAIEACDYNAEYIGKVAVRRLTLEKGKTTLECQMLMVFTPEEAKAYTETFISVEAANSAQNPASVVA
jgi:hypothetical protein